MNGLNMLNDRFSPELIEFKTLNLKVQRIKLSTLNRNAIFEIFDKDNIKYTKPTTKLVLGETVVSVKVRSNKNLNFQKLESSVSNRVPSVIIKKNIRRLPKPPRKIIYEIVLQNEYEIYFNYIEKWLPFKPLNLENLATEKNKERKVILNWGENDKKLKFLYEDIPVYDDYKPNIALITDNNVDLNYVLLDMNGLYEYTAYLLQFSINTPETCFQSNKNYSDSSSSDSDSNSYSGSENDSPIFIEFDDKISKQANELLKEHSIRQLVLNEDSIKDLFKSMDSVGYGFVEIEGVERVISLISSYFCKTFDFENVRNGFKRFVNTDGRLRYPNFQDFIELILQ